MLGTTSDILPRFINKKWIEVHDQSGNIEDRYNPSKQIRFKTSMLRSDLCDFSDAYIVVKVLLLLQIQIKMRMRKNYLLKIMHRLFLAFQKLIIYLLIVLKI